MEKRAEEFARFFCIMLPLMAPLKFAKKNLNFYFVETNP